MIVAARKSSLKPALMPAMLLWTRRPFDVGTNYISPGTQTKQIVNGIVSTQAVAQLMVIISALSSATCEALTVCIKPLRCVHSLLPGQYACDNTACGMDIRYELVYL